MASSSPLRPRPGRRSKWRVFRRMCWLRLTLSRWRKASLAKTKASLLRGFFLEMKENLAGFGGGGSLARTGNNFLNFTAANAGGAGANPLADAIDHCADGAQVHVPAALGHIVRVAD